MKKIQALVMVIGFLVCGIAWADVIPPDVAECQSKKEGDSCQTTDKKSGTCTKDKCSRLDYSDGTPPSSVDYDCLKCKAGSSNGNSNTTNTNGNTNGNANSNGSSGGTGCSVIVDSPLSLGFRLILLGLFGLFAWRFFTRNARSARS